MAVTAQSLQLCLVEHIHVPAEKAVDHAFFEAISGESLSTDESAELDTVLSELRSGGLEL